MALIKLQSLWLGSPDSKVGDVIEVTDEQAADLTTRGKHFPIAVLMEPDIVTPYEAEDVETAPKKKPGRKKGK